MPTDAIRSLYLRLTYNYATFLCCSIIVLAKYIKFGRALEHAGQGNLLFHWIYKKECLNCLVDWK